MNVYNTCLLFTNVEQLVAGMELQLATRTEPCVYHVLDDRYPVNRDINLHLMEKLKKRHEDKIQFYQSPRNLGFHEAFNYLTSLLPLEDDDLIITVAPDTVPLKRGWDRAFIEVMTDRPDIAYMSMDSYAIRETPGVEWDHQAVDGIGIKIPLNRPAMAHGSIFRWSFIKRMGGFKEPCAYYGHIESVLWSKLQEYGMKMAYLEDYGEDFRLEAYHDDVYRRWKIAHAHTFTFEGNLAEYIASGHE